MRDKLRFEERSRQADGSGGYVEAWQTVAGGVPARIIQKTGSERFTADTLAGVITHEIHIRYSEAVKGVNQLHRAVDERYGTVHNIRAATHDPKRAVIVLVTQTGVPV